MNTSEIMDSRIKGQFSISIATSLALEGLFGIMTEKQPVGNPVYTIFTEVWVNIRTLFRNIHGSLDKKVEGGLLSTDYYNVLLEEMNTLTGIIGQYMPACTVKFYANSYQSLSKLYPFAYFKEVKTDIQKEYASMENGAIEQLFKFYGKDNGILFAHDVTIRMNGGVCLLFTHYPLDLLSSTNYKGLSLLESHTGAVKHKLQWNTKLKGDNVQRIPFDRMTIQLFGDSGGLFTPYPVSTRKKLIELATASKWTNQTPKERVVSSVKSLREPIFENTITRLY